MSNIKDVKKIKEGTPLEIGGKKRYLKFDMNSFAELEEYAGNIEDVMDALEKGSIKALRSLLWAGLLHEFMDEDGVVTLKPHDIGSWVKMEDFPRLSEALGKALQEVMPSQGIDDDVETTPKNVPERPKK